MPNWSALLGPQGTFTYWQFSTEGTNVTCVSAMHVAVVEAADEVLLWPSSRIEFVMFNLMRSTAVTASALLHEGLLPFVC